VPGPVHPGQEPARERGAAAGPYNILLFLTDQERYFRPGELPKDYRLPARERLAKKGVVFENHRIQAMRGRGVLVMREIGARD